MGGGGGVVNVKVVLCALALRNLAHSPSNNPDDRHGYWGYSLSLQYSATFSSPKCLPCDNNIQNNK